MSNLISGKCIAAKEQLQIVTPAPVAHFVRFGAGQAETAARRLPPKFSAAAPMFAEIGYNFVAQAPPIALLCDFFVYLGTAY